VEIFGGDRYRVAARAGDLASSITLLDSIADEGLEDPDGEAVPDDEIVIVFDNDLRGEAGARAIADHIRTLGRVGVWTTVGASSHSMADLGVEVDIDLRKDFSVPDLITALDGFERPVPPA
jgi:hypothetical protein